MDKFKELKEKIGKRRKELREELRPFITEELKSRMHDLKKEDFERLSKEKQDQLINPREEVINKEIEEMITGVKNMLENMPKIHKVSSLNELITIFCFEDRELLKDWKDRLRKDGPEEICELLTIVQYAPIMYVPEDVEKLMREYYRAIAKKAEELTK